MRPGPERVVACPSCAELARYGTLLSGNNFLARLWTDGKEDAPMLPRTPELARCPRCTACYWLADAEVVGTVAPFGKERSSANPSWVAAPLVAEPDEEEYYQALERGLAADPQRERVLRMLAWWRRNDAYRDAPPGQTFEAAAGRCRKNMEALIPRLDEGMNDTLMQAEVLRELGEFDSARKVLSSVTLVELADVVRQVRSWCDKRDTCVRELELPGMPRPPLPPGDTAFHRKRR